jgi:hypothetical protein
MGAVWDGKSRKVGGVKEEGDGWEYNLSILCACMKM